MTDKPVAAGDPGPIPDFLRRTPEPKFHPLLDKLPKMGEEELDALARDIEANGLMEAITTTKDGMIIDGRNRYLAGKKVDYKFREEDFVELPEGVDPLTFVVSKNYQRLHLNAEQKRGLIAELLEANPEASSRAIAALVRVSHHLVEDVRQEMEEEEDDENSTGQFAQLKTRTGKDGKKRRKPVKRTGPPSPKELKKQVDDFKADWQSLNEWQRTYFVNSFKDEIAAILEEIEKREGTPAPTETPAPDEQAQVQA